MSATILLVEDSETQALQVRLLLEREGMTVDWAASAEAAIDRLNAGLPDLLIADYHLPGINGDELARRVRMNPRTRALPVLMLTEAHEVERQGLDSGADAHVPKSGDRTVLLARIRALLRRRDDAARPDGAPAADFRPPRLLVVDGSATYRGFLSAMLAQDGYAVETAAGPDAIPDEAWDGIVVGLDSHGFDAFALCTALDTKRAAGPEDRVFQIVGIGSDEPGRATIVRGFEAGADDVVPKTADPDAIRVRIRAVIRRKLLRDEDRRAAADSRERDLALARARAEAAAAEALADANRQLKETQAQLVQAAKMASLGELVAGIAHEINNPLAFILAHQATVERLVADDANPERLEKARSRLGAMRDGLERIQDLVVKLRRFSRIDEGEYQTIDVPQAIDGVVALLAHKLRDRVRVERLYEATPELHCSSGLLNQVVMNILGNAADAIPGEGRIVIATRSDADDYTIEVTDSGPGVPPELRERIFEPFFTTKDVGSGTGLGLAIAYRVVQSHGGDIAVGDGPDGGARFTVTIPRRPQP